MFHHISFLFSSLKEANALLYQSKIEFIKINDYFYSEKTNSTVRICGIGRKSTDFFLNNLKIDSRTLYVKLGACAVTDSDIPLLEAVIPNFVCYEKNIEQINESLLIPQLKILFKKETKLLTIEEPLSSGDKADSLFRSGYDFIDMESYFLLKMIGTGNFLPIVVGSDNGQTDSRKIFFENLNKVSVKLKDIAQSFF